MKRILGCLPSLLILALSSISTIYAFEGPLNVGNQFPLFLHIDAPRLEKAAIETSFSASLSHSSVYLVQDSHQWSAGIDMEFTELGLAFRKNFGDRVEIGVEVPVLSFNSGFMDGFLSTYHDTFGFPDYGRSDRPDNAFLYEIREKGVLVIRGESGRIGIGDIRVILKKPLLRSDPAISLQGSIELPSGDAEAGYGNGSIDAGIALMIDKNLGEKVKSYVNLGVVFPGDLRAHKKIDLREFIYGGASVEAAVWKSLDLVGQVFIQGSPFPDIGISEIDRTAILLSLGGRYHADRDSFELSFTEDPNTSGAPDFTVNFSFRRKF
ncbi:MAG: DUF3187 family protein [Nitrospirota bacterium]